MRDAMQAVHDRTVELMTSGADLYTAMREVTVPEHLDVGEGYGKTSWNVRAIWEMYAGWFQHRSTTELYGVAPNSVAADVVTPPAPTRSSRRPALTSAAGRPVQALHLTDLVLGCRTRPRRGPGGRTSTRTKPAGRHRELLGEAWLTKSINELRTAK